MLGHLMEWFYGGLGGIDQTDRSVGYQEAFIAPQMVKGIDNVSTDFQTPYGKIVSKWSKSKKGKEVEVAVPVNANAILILPVIKGNDILENGVSIRNSPDVKLVSQTSDKATLKIGSGVYKFQF